MLEKKYRDVHDWGRTFKKDFVFTNEYNEIGIYHGVLDILNSIDVIASMEKSIVNFLLLMSLLSHRNASTLSASIIGSVAKNCFTNKFSDLDILLLVEDDFKDDLFLLDLKSYGFDFTPIDDIYVCTINNQDVSICFKHYHEFTNYLEDLINGKYYDIIKKPWVIGGKIEEVVLTDIKFSIILFDKEKKLVKIKNGLNENYPLKLHNCFIILSDEILQKACMVLKYIEKNKSPIEIFTGYYEILVDLSRYIGFKTQKYHYGYKHFLMQKDFYFFENIYLSTSVPSIFEVKSNIALIISILENDLLR